MTEPDYFYYDPAEWQGEQPDWEIEDWYPEYDADDDGYREDFYTDDNDPWVYDEDDSWSYPDEDDETEAPF